VILGVYVPERVSVDRKEKSGSSYRFESDKVAYADIP
jgi:hypothetical protein